jgi:hypothetical protein
MGKPGNESKKTNRPTADFSIRRMQSSVWPPSVQGTKTVLKKVSRFLNPKHSVVILNIRICLKTRSHLALGYAV